MLSCKCITALQALVLIDRELIHCVDFQIQVLTSDNLLICLSLREAWKGGRGELEGNITQAKLTCRVVPAQRCPVSVLGNG